MKPNCFRKLAVLKRYDRNVFRLLVIIYQVILKIIGRYGRFICKAYRPHFEYPGQSQRLKNKLLPPEIELTQALSRVLKTGSSSSIGKVLNLTGQFFS